ncbi:unnamed protein product [Kluyveromyces dobzhanskii CBS 2104]|uniref:WGS project CCBQ000000000 data, contig 00104 n=1 Tax=Kluyveromyces dobzhanskii CBS 2104 TaxID=1427455 RepID=A0A0A8L659_9SACH|nr:unnamed protein product [Kluyveromyces dobzhanskii CBS 2104]
MSTITFQDTWTSFSGTETSVRCTTSPNRTPTGAQDRKTALSVSIYHGTADLSSGSSKMYLQGYSYGIQFVGSGKGNNEVCIADLIETRDHQTHDLIHKITRILAIRYRRPCYVQLSSRTSGFALNGPDQISLLQGIANCIDSHTVEGSSAEKQKLGG